MSFKEQRRFPRVTVRPAMAEMVSALGAQVTWPNLEISDVMDLSYKGVAARRPGLYPVAVKNRADVEVKLGLCGSFKVAARVAWCNLDWVGLEFAQLPPEGHQAMTEYFDARLLGVGLKPVERVFFTREAGFNHWFQGPSGVHVFVWLNSNRLLERVNVDFGEVTVQFVRGQSLGRAPDREQRKALLILSQMDKQDLPMEEFVRTLGPGA